MAKQRMERLWLTMRPRTDLRLLASSAGGVARVALLQQKLDTVVDEHTLFHGETLLVVATRDADNVASPLGSEMVGRDFLSHALVIELLEFLLVVNLVDLLAPGRGVRNVQLHDEVVVWLSLLDNRNRTQKWDESPCTLR